MTATTSGGGRPKTGYFARDGKRVPGVTSVLIYKDPGALMWWAWKQGSEGKDFRETRDKAADAGHAAHAMIEANIHGRPMPDRAPDLDVQMKAEQAFEAFLEWRKGVSLQIIDTERPLVSELHRYGGTYDALAVVNGKPALLDWKSGSGIYPETIAQLAAYRELIRENCGSKRELAPEGAYCLRVGKEMGDFHHHGYTREILDLGWERFQAAKWMYTLDQTLKGVCQ